MCTDVYEFIHTSPSPNAKEGQQTRPSEEAEEKERGRHSGASSILWPLIRGPLPFPFPSR